VNPAPANPAMSSIPAAFALSRGDGSSEMPVDTTSTLDTTSSPIIDRHQNAVPLSTASRWTPITAESVLQEVETTKPRTISADAKVTSALLEDDEERFVTLWQNLDEVVNAGYGQTVVGFLQKNPKSLKIVEEVVYHSIATKRRLEAKTVFSEKELAEFRCLANLGDYIRPELDPFADGIRDGGYEWSDIIKWWRKWDKTFQKRDTEPAQHIMDIIDSVYHDEEGWVRGGAWHQRLYQKIAGLALFWSERCRRSHADTIPPRHDHPRRYQFLAISIKKIEDGVYAFSNALAESAVTGHLRHTFVEYEDLGNGLVVHKNTRREFRLLEEDG